ncbi:ABC transporter ATP-binding protein [Streptacidiphilus sp. ASG 303]|uniref:ABC transporter ATP-binding protein n=1 Tax=Streptomycetaceae TaxID=2062 RepID=UPI001E2D3456|nr:ABC transporter ATP-binding protein [Streptacidiphilus sp. ASG 303]MCD0484795.1 ABC transporter ATP-binding protein [Streptacidiphilus sp. ASG 303]
MLRVRGLVRTHRSEGSAVRALDGVDLDVDRGEFVAVMGPSGAGKSTLLHLLGGLDRPDGGQIWLEGRRVDGLSEARWALLRRRSVGIVFQFSNLVSTMTVADNVELPALLAGASARQARTRREELLGELGLADKARAVAAGLSGGEQQRVALARALVNEPGLLLADEPTGSLDSRSTRDVLRLLTRFHEQGRTIVLVTHDARVAATAERVVSLFDGRVADDAAVESAPRGRRTTLADVLELKG